MKNKQTSIKSWSCTTPGYGTTQFSFTIPNANEPYVHIKYQSEYLFPDNIRDGATVDTRGSPPFEWLPIILGDGDFAFAAVTPAMKAGELVSLYVIDAPHKSGGRIELWGAHYLNQQRLQIFYNTRGSGSVLDINEIQVK